MKKTKSVLNEIELYEKDERIKNLKNKIYSEEIALIYLIISITYLYNLIILQKSSFYIVIIVISSIYQDIRLAFNKAYMSNIGSKLINFSLCICITEYLYKLIAEESNFIIILAISLILSIIYNKILNYVNNK